jgi:acyl dehydratase
MQDYGNRTFDEIEIGASATATRTLTATDVEALALAAGDVEGLHIEGYDHNERLTAQGAAAIAMIAGLVNRRLPGPGARIILSRIHYAGIINIGDTLTASVVAKAKHKRDHAIEFDCRCVNQAGEVLVDGSLMVTAPTQRIQYSNVATPELILRRNDGFAPLFARCKTLDPITCAVVHPCDRASLLGPIEAARMGLIVPVLVGPEAKIRAVAKDEGIDLSPYQIVAVEHSHAAAETAVELARLGHVEDGTVEHDVAAHLSHALGDHLAQQCVQTLQHQFGVAAAAQDQVAI